MKLIRLDNGDWIDPRQVRSVRPRTIMSSYVDSETIPPGVIVEHSFNTFSVIDLELHTDPVKAADELSEKINALRE